MADFWLTTSHSWFMDLASLQCIFLFVFTICHLFFFFNHVMFVPGWPSKVSRFSLFCATLCCGPCFPSLSICMPCFYFIAPPAPSLLLSHCNWFPSQLSGTSASSCTIVVALCSSLFVTSCTWISQSFTSFMSFILCFLASAVAFNISFYVISCFICHLEFYSVPLLAQHLSHKLWQLWFVSHFWSNHS